MDAAGVERIAWLVIDHAGLPPSRLRSIADGLTRLAAFEAAGRPARPRPAGAHGAGARAPHPPEPPVPTAEPGTPTYTMLALGDAGQRMDGADHRDRVRADRDRARDCARLSSAPGPTSTAPLSAISPMHRRLAIAGAFTLPGLLVRLSGGASPYPLQLLAYGAAVVAAAFMLAWATRGGAGRRRPRARHRRRRVRRDPAGVHRRGALRVHRPGAVRDGEPDRREPAAARCGGRPAGRLGAAARVAGGGADRAARAAPAHRLELAILALGGLWAMRGVVRGELTPLDSVVLIGLYVLYLRRVASIGGEAPPPIGVAAQLAALPRAAAPALGRRADGSTRRRSSCSPRSRSATPCSGPARSSASSPYLLLQWIVPDRDRGAGARRRLRAADARPRRAEPRGAARRRGEPVHARARTLPLAYQAGAGVGPLPLAGRERIELFLTIGVALYAIASLVMLRLSRGDSAMMLALFARSSCCPASTPGWRSRWCSGSSPSTS